MEGCSTSINFRKSDPNATRTHTVKNKKLFIYFVEKLCKKGFPLTSQELRTVACTVQQQDKGPDHPVQEKTMLSYKWERGFLNRHPQLKKATPRNLSVHRAMCTSKAVVDKFFRQYSHLRQHHNITKSCLWNLDETGVDNIPVVTTVIGLEGVKTQMIVSGDRGNRTSIVVLISADGGHFPPMIIHKGENVQPSWYTYAQDDHFVRCSVNGYISKELFSEYMDLWLDHLEESGRLTEQHLLLVDGHSTHTYNHQAMFALREAGVKCMLLPAHTSHTLQPLDKMPFASFKHWWKVHLHHYNRQNSGVALNKENFCQVFNIAFWKAMKRENVRAGFRVTGLEPINRARITDEMLEINECFQSKKNNLYCVLFCFCSVFVSGLIFFSGYCIVSGLIVLYCTHVK